MEGVRAPVGGGLWGGDRDKEFGVLGQGIGFGYF